MRSTPPSIQRIALPHQDGTLALHSWPAEVKPPAEVLYWNDRLLRAVVRSGAKQAAQYAEGSFFRSRGHQPIKQKFFPGFARRRLARTDACAESRSSDVPGLGRGVP